MSAVQELLASACLVGLALSAAEAILPSERFATQIKLLFSCVFLVCVLSGASRLTFSDIISSGDGSASASEGSALEQSIMAEAAESVLEEELAKALEAEKIMYKKIEVHVNIGEDNCISISKAVITDGGEGAEETAKSLFGEDTEVSVCNE